MGRPIEQSDGVEMSSAILNFEERILDGFL